MTLATFFFLLTGVLLNAGAHLLLKAGVKPLGALSIEASTLLATIARVLTQWPWRPNWPAAPPSFLSTTSRVRPPWAVPFT